MRQFTRLFILCVTAAMVLSVFSGCGGGGKKNSGEIVNNTYKEGYPIVKEPVTLKVMAMSIPLHADFDTMDFTKIMQEKTNIKIDWDVTLNGPEVNDKKVLAFNSGNMPDMFFIVSHMTDADVMTYGPAGILADQKQYIDNGWAPNIKKMFADHPEFEAAVTADDGKIYSMAQFNSTVKNHGNYRNKMYINKTWLDNLALEVPKTTEDFEKVLKAFKNSDPNGNGLKDEIPFTATNLDPAMFGPWGLSFWWDMDMMTILDTGKVQYTLMDDAYRQGLTFYNRLFKEGLIDEEIIGQTDAQISKKANASETVLGCFMTFAESLVLSEERSKDYVMMPALIGPEGKQSWTNTSRYNISPHYFVLSEKCKYKEAAMRWVDYLYSEEGTLLAWNGPDGKMYEVQDDGKIKNTEANAPKDDSGKQIDGNTWRYRLTPGYILPYYWSENINERGVELKKSSMTSDQLRNDALTKDSYALYDKVKPKYVMPYIMFSSADAARIAEIAGPIHQLANGKTVEFFYGDASIDAEWDSYVKNLKSMGIDELIQIYQKYIDKKIKK